MADSPSWTQVAKPKKDPKQKNQGASQEDAIPAHLRALLAQAEAADRADADLTQKEIAENEANEVAYGLDDWRHDHDAEPVANNPTGANGEDGAPMTKSQKKKKKKEQSAWQKVPQTKKKDAPQAKANKVELSKGVFGQMTSQKKNEQAAIDAQAQKNTKKKQANKLQHQAKKKGLTGSKAPGSTSISAADLALYIKEAADKYPDSVDAQLKSLAEVYARSFDGLEVTNSEEDHLQLDRALEKPLANISGEPLKLTVQFLKSVPRANLLSFVKFMVPVLAGADIKLDPSQTPGIKILLQIIARQFPTVVAQSTGDLLPKLGSPATRSFFLWWVAQIVLADPTSAAVVWGHVLIPLLAHAKQKPQYQTYLLHYLEALTSQPEKLKILRASKKVFVPKESLEVFLKYRGEQLLSQTKKGGKPLPQLSRVMVAVLNISVFLQQEESPRLYFPTLFRLASTDNIPLRTEILKTLMHCLARDRQCMEMWVQLYPLIFRESSDLLACIQSKWKSNPGWLNKGLKSHGIDVAVQSFLDTNEQLKSDTYEPPPRIRKQLQAKPQLRKISKDDMAKSDERAILLMKQLRGRGFIYYLVPTLMTAALAGVTATHLCAKCAYQVCGYVLKTCAT